MSFPISSKFAKSFFLAKDCKKMGFEGKTAFNQANDDGLFDKIFIKQEKPLSLIMNTMSYHLKEYTVKNKKKLAKFSIENERQSLIKKMNHLKSKEETVETFDSDEDEEALEADRLQYEVDEVELVEVEELELVVESEELELVVESEDEVELVESEELEVVVESEELEIVVESEDEEALELQERKMMEEEDLDAPEAVEIKKEDTSKLLIDIDYFKHQILIRDKRIEELEKENFTLKKIKCQSCGK